MQNLIHNTLLVYSPRITQRLRYIFKLMFTELHGIKVSFTDDAETFHAFNGPRISYAFHPLANEFFIAAKNLLFETGIRDQETGFSHFEDEPVLFLTGRHSRLPFDPFAAAFYMVTRYEEYLPEIHDKHDRFEAHQSLAYKKGFLLKPVVNIWSAILIKSIIKEFPHLICAERKYRFISTIDIDNAWAYKGKGFLRTGASLARCMVQLNFKELGERLRVLSGMNRDPYDTYEYQQEVQERYNLKYIYFILFGDYADNDKNVPVYNTRFQELIKSLADRAQIGIHPSYQSNYKESALLTELNRLSKVINREITLSRQHFLKLELPRTYHKLLQAGITDDYTMGFASEIGFRAGICNSFMFYDLDNETETKLRLHPFQVMDASLRYYMNVSPDEATLKIKPIIQEVKKVNGTFISLWHNESLSNVSPWQGWRSVYEEMVMDAVPLTADNALSFNPSLA